MTQNITRIYLAILGMIAFRAWVWLTEPVFNISSGDALPNPFFIYGFFALTVTIATKFALHGPLKAMASWVRALIIGLISTLIFAYMRARFGDGETSIPNDLSLLWLSLAIAISWPFMITLALKKNIWDYETLHETAWTIFIRGCIAFAFGWVMVLIVNLANWLFLAVGFELLNDFLYIKKEPYGYNSQNLAWFYGFGFGIAAAVTWEMQKLLSVLRFVLITLLRILLPIILLVLVVFVPLMLINGFGSFEDFTSPTALLISLLLITTSLISAMIEGEPPTGNIAKFMDIMTKAVIVLSAIVAPFMLFGIIIRLQEHGFTPSRIFALSFAILSSIYIFGYVFSIIFKRAIWKEAIAKVNIINALSIAFIALILCSPIGNPFRISANSQASKILEKNVDITRRDLRSFRQWGKSGEALFAQKKKNPLKKMIQIVWHYLLALTMAVIVLMTMPTKLYAIKSTKI